ncbi:hypothetical protein C8R44DRAFT_249942 [Mycena epipterygia]|nr:hypothetical protein C8R44DRAFT_249942 [Mycena epipterygia]
MDDSSTTVTLPPDLERCIFEIAGLLRPRAIPTLMRVAWRVRYWVEPLLYRTLLIRHYYRQGDCFPCCSVETFMEIASTERVSFLRGAVRNLMVCMQFADKTHVILSTCLSVENLSIVLFDNGSLLQPSPPALNNLPLKHLYCQDLGEFVALTSFQPFRHPSYHQITHLELSEGLRENWTRLVELPQLTHLSLHLIADLPFCRPILDMLQSLRVLVLLQLPPRNPPAELALLADNPRFVMMLGGGMLPHNNHINLQKGVHTGIDYWVHVDQLIAKRISGQSEGRTSS